MHELPYETELATWTIGGRCINISGAPALSLLWTIVLIVIVLIIVIVLLKVVFAIIAIGPFVYAYGPNLQDPRMLIPGGPGWGFDYPIIIDPNDIVIFQ